MVDPDGLLAAGGALTPEWLVEAYARGIFPWFGEEDEHIFWWSPSNRAVLKPGEMKVSRSLGKRIRNSGFEVTLDLNFKAVVEGCQQPRDSSSGTWITEEMLHAYSQMHEAGLAHSVEVREGQELVGGLYGISLGKFFFGESMFSRKRDASKIGFYCLSEYLKELDFDLIDCQIQNPHLASLGVREIPRYKFLDLLAQNPLNETRQGRWHFS